MSAADTLVGFAAVASLLALAYGPWQATCTDIARQYCFSKRDQLFDVARTGRIDFRSNEYRAMRLSLEKTIRYCHEMSIFKLILFGFDRTDTDKSSYASTLSKAASRVVDPSTRRDLEKLAYEVEDFMILVIWMKSPLLWLLTIPAIAIAIVALLFSETRRYAPSLVRALGERVQIQAECG